MSRKAWAVVTPILGVNLWAILCLVPLQIEWSSQDTRWWAMALYLLPLALLAAGTATRASLALLAGFVVSLVPAYLVLPELDRAVYREGLTFLALATSMVAYVASAAMWTQTLPPRFVDGTRVAADDGRDIPATLGDPPPRAYDLWWPYSVHFPVRWFLLLAMLIVPLYGLNFADGVAERYVESFARDADQARVMANLLVIFGWVVVGYIYFISPGLNLELEQRELDRAVDRYEKRAMGQPRLWLIVAGSLLAVIMIGVLLAVTA